ncbi:MAG: hypothetical protein H8D22_07400 [Candidatus Cloacimonetes bacterium]|nr:hypothetical protein [Candidatus Cloacimonadota bacterium]
MVLFLLFSVSSIWANKEATTMTTPTERTAPIVKKAEARPVIPDDLIPKIAKKGQVAPINDDYEATKSRVQRGGVVNVYEDDFETEGSFWYYAGAAYIFSLPDQYGDEEFGTRFTVNHTTADLDGAWFYWYSAVGTPSATVHVYDCVDNYPGTELGSVPVPWASIALGWNYVDLTSLSLSFDCGEEFFITYSVDDGIYGTTQLNIITDNGSSGANRSIEYWGAWEYMYLDWGTDYEFCIDVVLSYPDTWISQLSKFHYLEDSPSSKDTVSYSPTHCWWVDEETTGGFKDYLVSPEFTIPAGFPLYYYSMEVNIEFMRSSAGPGSIDEYYEVWIVDKDAGVTDFWHTDTLNHYAGENSWWCGKFQAGWSGGWGYGNSWNQWVQTPVMALPALKDSISLDFMQRSDSEPGFDFCYVEISNDNFITFDNLATYDDAHNTWTAAHILLSSYAGQNVSVRFRFESDGGWSDEDGLYASQGAWFLDNVIIYDGSKTTYFEDNADDQVNFLINPGNEEWTRLFYDYDRDYPAPSTGYELVDKDFIFNGTCNLTPYAGKNVQFKIAAQVDDSSYAHGAGLFIDDIVITGIDLPQYDMACDLTVVPYPTTVGLDCKSVSLYPSLIMHEAGYAATGANGRINVEGSGSSPPLYNYYVQSTSPLALNDYGIYELTRSPFYTPVAGTYNYDGWVEGVTGDPDPDNDHAPPMPVTIYPEGQYELGYNSRVEGQFYFPTCTGAVTYYSPFRDGVFSSSKDYQITGIRHMLYNRFIPGASPSDTLQWAPLTFKIYNAADSVTLGALIYEEEIMLPSQTRISWVEFPFATPVPITDDYFIHITGEFIDGNTTATHPKYFILVDDNSQKYLGTSYYSGHAFNYGISAKDSLELHNMDYWVNALINVDVPLPGYCEDLTIAKSGNDIVLDWKAMPNATDYKVYYSTDPYTGFVELVGTTGGAVTCTHTGGAAGTKFFYKVTGF